MSDQLNADNIAFRVGGCTLSWARTTCRSMEVVSIFVWTRHGVHLKAVLSASMLVGRPGCWCRKLSTADQELNFRRQTLTTSTTHREAGVPQHQPQDKLFRSAHVSPLSRKEPVTVFNALSYRRFQDEYTLTWSPNLRLRGCRSLLGVRCPLSHHHLGGSSPAGLRC